MTGTDFLSILKLRVGQAYSGLLQSNAQSQRIVTQALTETIEDSYRTLTVQKRYDELRNVIVADSPFTLTGGAINLTTTIADYLHLLAVKAHFIKPLLLTVTNATNTTPIVVIVTERNNIRTGEQLRFSGFLGNTAANGDFFVRKLNEFQFALYSDADLQSPVAGNSAYTGGGAIGRIFFNYCKQFTSDVKISPLSQPTADAPKFEMANSSLIIHPTGSDTIRIDYIKKSADIDISNNVTDIETVYPKKLLYFILDRARIIFFEIVRDMEGYQESVADKQTNP